MNNPLPDFSKASVLVIGDLMLDRYWFGDAARISPEAPVPIVNIKHIDERPGGAGNVALNVSALGVNTTLIGAIGKDDAGRILTDQLAAAGVSHDIHCVATIPTITKHRVISQHQQLLRMDFEEKFPAFDPASLLKYYTRNLADTKLVILSDYGKGTLTSAPELIDLAKKAGITVLVDPKGTDYSKYRGADLITPNYKEFEAIVGHCHNEQDIVTKGQQLLKQHDIKALLLTRGERGMTLIRPEMEEFHLPAHAREVFDVTGAGDTVIAVLGAALAAGTTVMEAMTLANLAASLVVAKLGAATVSAPELDAALSNKMTTTGGIVNEEQLHLAVSEARMKGKRIIFTNGCFDILHAGHVTYLEQAKQLGDVLIVAINDDDSVRRLKGAGRPINSVEQRMAVLAGLSVVDWVTPFSDDTPERLLKLLQPDILVKGGDYTTDGVVGAKIVRTYGGDVRVLGVIKNLSTTAIIDRVVQQKPGEQDK
ncbi:MAG TPA: bifunctional D-glycero-beta-D-manno-heptose-7-phosphate kinase/D-glycero-beta-D-manno-heptose 1-phosphate adenylyltransferase HldE [Gammaproteobacteria bacterium]|nr:bifunctional D-glycero-beta-D-manno-heptose-7-phosphate kinase/D-glycero-beta-D-manno-heptose 1-phosphate adenylyltransferase HldE [Gammaproteobacteria bacterium]